jgi:hypothetical protein
MVTKYDFVLLMILYMYIQSTRFMFGNFSRGSNDILLYYVQSMKGVRRKIYII